MADQYIKSSVYVAVTREQTVLLQRRQNTGYADGYLSLVAGHLLPGENAVAAAVRELQEEVGIDCALEDLRMEGIVHRPSVEGGQLARVDFLVSLPNYMGHWENREDDLASEIVWADLNDLPRDLAPEVDFLLKRFTSTDPREAPWFSSPHWDRYQPTPVNTAKRVGSTANTEWGLVLRKTIGGSSYRWDQLTDTIAVDGHECDHQSSRYDRTLGVQNPVDLCVELTTQCNLQCDFCFSDSGPGLSYTHLSIPNLLQALRDRRETLIRVCIAGGEPLLHPEIGSVLALPNQWSDIGFVLNTNGTVGTQYDDQIVAEGWLVALSLHGSESSHNKYTRSHSYSRVVRRIETLAAGTVVHVYCVLSGSTKHTDLSDLVQTTFRSGASFLRLIVPRKFGRQGDDPPADVLEYARELASEHHWIGLKETASNSTFLTAFSETRHTH